MNEYTQRPRAVLQIDAFRFDSYSDDNRVVWQPAVLSAHLTKNNHLEADELTVKLAWRAAGTDPRALKNARGEFWFWDDNREEFDDVKHLRFQGIAKKIERSGGDQGMEVEITFHDFTSLFIASKPFPSEGMPEWSDDLATVWRKICDHTGWFDPNQVDPVTKKKGRIVSSVVALRDNLVADPQSPTASQYLGRPIGSIVNERFMKIDKPTPPRYASSWDVWKWITGSLGLVSYIKGDKCILSDTVEHYDQDIAPVAVWGENIYEFQETADTEIGAKGVLVESFNTLTGQVMEARWPLPGDERIKTNRAAVGKKSEGGATVTANEVSTEYVPFYIHSVQNQEALDRLARGLYEEYSRQQLTGSFKTADMTLEAPLGEDVVRVIDILDLEAGDPIRVKIDRLTKDHLRDLGSDKERVKHLVDICGFDEGLAELCVINLNVEQIADIVFHVERVEMEFESEKLEFTIHYHNLINATSLVTA